VELGRIISVNPAMTSVVQRIHVPTTGGTAHRVGLGSPLPEEDNRRKSGGISLTSQAAPRRTSSPADFGFTKSPIPPPVAKKPDWLKRSLKKTPPPAPIRSSSISTVQTVQKGVVKDENTAVEMIKEAKVSTSDYLNMKRNTSASPSDIHPNFSSSVAPTHIDSSTQGHSNSNTSSIHSGSNGSAVYHSSKPIPIPDHSKSQTLQRNRTSMSPTSNHNGHDQTTGTSLSAASVSSGRRLHSSFSTSQPQLNKLDQHMLVKPRDRIRSILVEDATSIDDDPTSLQDDYGSSYNTSLMKMTHSDLQKHTIAVMMPMVPPPTAFSSGGIKPLLKHRSSSMGGDKTDGRQHVGSGISSNIASNVKKLEDSTESVAKLDPRDRAHTSPYHSRKDNAANRSSADRSEAEVNSLTLSDPIARAYRQHLMTKMEQGKRLGGGGGGGGEGMTARTSPGHHARATSTQGGSLTRTYPHAHQHQEVGSTGSWESTAKGMAGSGSVVRTTPQQHAFTSEKKDATSEDALRSGSPSIMESVRFFENVQVAQGQVGVYGTMPRTYNHHNSHGSLGEQGGGASSQSEWRKKAKSIDNLYLIHENSDADKEPLTVGNGFSPNFSRQGGARSAHSISGGEVWPSADTSNANIINPSFSSYSSSAGSSTMPSPHSQQASSSGSPPGIQSSNFGLSHQTNIASNNAVLKSLAPSSRTMNVATKPLTIGAADTKQEEVNELGPNEFMFFDYVTIHSSQLPKRVKITRALTNDANKLTLATGDLLDLHFIRKVKAVKFIDSHMTTLVMPINSSMKLSALYDPFGSDKMATIGFTFETAGSIMDLRDPPKVVAVKRSVTGATPESSLVQGEILVVQGMRNSYHGRLLRAFSLTTNLEKLLDESCRGDFTTEPALIKMALSDVLEHSILLPQKAVLHWQDCVAENAPAGAACSLQNPVTLKKFVIASYVVATPTINTHSRSREASLLEIYANVNIVVEELPALRDQRNTFLRVAQDLINSSAYKHAVPYFNCLDPASFSLQCTLSNLNSSSPPSYEIVAPRGVTVPPQKHAINAQKLLQSKPSSQEINERKLAAMEQKYAGLEEKVSGMSARLEEVCQRVEKIHVYLSKAQTAMNDHKRRLSSKPPEDITRRRSSSTGKHHSHSSSQRELSSSSSPLPPLPGSELRPPTGSAPKSSESSSTATTTGKFAATNKKLLHSSYSFEDTSDDVFVAKDTQPPVLHPKPQIVPSKSVAVMTTKQQKLQDEDGNLSATKLPTKQAASKPTEKTGAKKSSSSSSSVLSTSSSIRQSVDLSDFLLLDPSTKAKSAPANGDDHAQKLPQTSMQGDSSSTDGDLDISNWCSKIEDELTKLYNESIMTVP